LTEGSAKNKRPELLYNHGSDTQKNFLSMVDDTNIFVAVNTAFLAVSRRAEAVDRETLVRTFVDVGPLLAVLSSRDHQIVYGRLGTGKTHALLYLTEQSKANGDAVVYLDLRNIGSSGGLYADASVPLTQRATRLLLDVLGATHETLLQLAIGANLELSTVGPALDNFATAATEVEVVGEVERESRESGAREEETSSSVRASLQKWPALEISSSGSAKSSSQSESRVAESGQARYRVHFGSVGRALTEVVKALGRRLLIVLDEWSAIPLDLQPYLADLIRRAVFPVVGITVKVAAIEQRSKFNIGPHSDYTGIEIGADASADVDLDDYLVFDNNAERATQFFKELLFRHYRSAPDPKPEFTRSDELIQTAFTQHNAFEDFVRAAEGVPRDAFNVLFIAVQRSLSERISIPTIRVAARIWFQRDKEGAIRANLAAEELLHRIVDEVIAHRRARAFLLAANTRHPLIDALFDARVLHVIKRSISSHDEPGVRYDAYKLDYGCYVDLLATSRAPNKLFAVDEDDEAGAAVNVPPDDYRAIRRAILDLRDVQKYGRT
jgi:KaiC/GvpD/RAD55 family RecA-like ATPase